MLLLRKESVYTVQFSSIELDLLVSGLQSHGMRTGHSNNVSVSPVTMSSELWAVYNKLLQEMEHLPQH